MKRLMAFLASVGTILSLSAQEYFVKELIFPDNASLEERVEMAARLVPTDRQLAWQDLELTAFLHFGINTFTDKEWGDGQEDPAIFNPECLDTDQWVKTLTEAGFKMVILTAKHHDGFCLWPTATTDHSVASSSWLGGKGDVVKMLSESCQKYGMKLGLYLSPWDRNAQCYGDSPVYNDMFVAQLTELLSHYGKVDEVWFDGACGEGPSGKKQQYDWSSFKSTIETLQPDAVMAIMGDDVRWVGNEGGLGRETEWSATVLTPGILPGADEENQRLGLRNMSSDLGSRDLLMQAKALRWWPSEVDVSIRKGWFYHESERPKSTRALADIYLNSVGRNSVLLLNVPPDNRGLISQADSVRLLELRKWIDDNFTINLISNRQGLEASLSSEANCFAISEDISRGQRVEEFAIDAWADGEWKELAVGTTIGKKRIILLPQAVGGVVRLRIDQSRSEPYAMIEGAYSVKMPLDEDEVQGAMSSISHEGWALVTPANGGSAIDGERSTEWRSDAGTCHLAVDMGAEHELAGFVYTPSSEYGTNGVICKYKFYVSADGIKWQEVPTSGEFSNIEHNPNPQIVLFDTAPSAHYFMLVGIEQTGQADYINIAEIDIIGQ